MDQLISVNEAHWGTRMRHKYNALIEIVRALVEDSEQVVAVPFYPFAEILTEENIDEIIPEGEENRYDTRLLEGMALGSLYVTNVKVG